jgi:hypothetical protein
MHPMCGPELEWVDDEEWLHRGQASYDVIISFSYLPLFSINSEPVTFMSKNYVCNNDPYSGLSFVGVLMHTFDPLCVSKWFTGCKPGNTQWDDSLLSLNDQMEWFRR